MTYNLEGVDGIRSFCYRISEDAPYGKSSELNFVSNKLRFKPIKARTEANGDVT